MKSAAFHIKAAGAGMGAVLALLQQQSFGEGENWSAENFTTLLLSPAAQALVIVETKTENPVGFLLWNQGGGEAEIINFCILPDYRRCGLGLQLLAAFQTSVQAAGIGEIFLEVRIDNQPARSLYEKAGFKSVGYRKDYYKGPGQKVQDAVIMKYATLQYLPGEKGK